MDFHRSSNIFPNSVTSDCAHFDSQNVAAAASGEDSSTSSARPTTSPLLHQGPTSISLLALGRDMGFSDNQINKALDEHRNRGSNGALSRESFVQLVFDLNVTIEEDDDAPEEYQEEEEEEENEDGEDDDENEGNDDEDEENDEEDVVPDDEEDWDVEDAVEGNLPENNASQLEIQKKRSEFLQNQIALSSAATPKTSGTTADNACVVCMDNPSSHVFLPCGHLKTCGTCSARVNLCPVCRGAIKSRHRVYQ